MAPPRPTALRTLPASALNGTYHWRITSAGAREAARLAGGRFHPEDVGGIGKMTLRDGGWVMGDTDPEQYSGTYKIKGLHRNDFIMAAKTNELWAASPASNGG